MEQLQSLIPEEYLVYVTTLVAFCAALAVFLPAPSESSNVFYTYGYKAVQWIALNFGNATNANSTSVASSTTNSETVSSDGNS